MLLGAADLLGTHPEITELDPCKVPGLEQICEIFDKFDFNTDFEAERPKVEEMGKELDQRREKLNAESDVSSFADDDEFSDTILHND